MPENDRKEFALELKQKREDAGVSRRELSSWFPQYREVTKNWERLDSGFRVPSEKDYQTLVNRLGISERWRIRVQAEDKRRLISDDGVDRRGDGTVIGIGHSGRVWESTTGVAQQWKGWGTALKPAHEPIVMARKPITGTVASNVLEHGTGAINVDGCRVETDENLNGGAYAKSGTTRDDGWGMQRGNAGQYQQPEGRFPANFIHDGSDEATQGLGEASRYFYCAKASKRDRDEGCEGLGAKARPTMGSGIGGQPDQQRANNRNHHPTVKPTDLMRYLCRLVTPPDGTVLDPFMGSGSTGKAAMLEGFKFVGIEREPEYADIAKARIEAAVKSVKQGELL
jgi:site-specific DNA-methyltransferase (adenine-specific)